MPPSGNDKAISQVKSTRHHFNFKGKEINTHEQQVQIMSQIKSLIMN